MADQDRPLAETSPGFLGLLDADPERAWSAFYTAATRLLLDPRSMPGALRRFPVSERHELVHGFLCHCCWNSFRVLRRYTDSGHPFASWLRVVANHWLADRWREPARSRTDSLEDDARPVVRTGSNPDHEATRNLLWEKVWLCVDRLGARCRILLHGSIEDLLKPQDLALLVGLPPEKNKEVSDMLRHCRRRLRQALSDEGIGAAELKAMIA